ncbi:divalent-cation tolerance protein CutA [uncultured Sphingomonas sp.]|uniref:divalent-cation tolerance protein CutA n=1 Tax=uncultured Sphingomonas sp. TaxID=158754 RepID=UPI002634D02D|nr:divalent-cation tolerance protein CutA [uncultured Sphingomonas sp.]
MNNIAIVQVTCPDAATAETIARTLLYERLITCANIFDKALSLYRWEGAIMQGDEVVMQLKTAPIAIPAIRARIATLHPYDLPAIEHWQATVTEQLAAWIADGIEA